MTWNDEEYWSLRKHDCKNGILKWNFSTTPPPSNSIFKRVGILICVQDTLCGEPTLQYDLFQQKQHQQKHTVLLCIIPCSFLKCTSGFLFGLLPVSQNHPSRAPPLMLSLDRVITEKEKAGPMVTTSSPTGTLQPWTDHIQRRFSRKRNRSTMWGPRKKIAKLVYNSMMYDTYISHMLHVWNMYQHLP